MPMTNAALVEAFINGATHGQSSTMEILEGPLSHAGSEYVHEGETALVGYGWAIYAKNTGSRIVIFGGWYEWANDKPGQSGHTTLQHLNLVGDKSDPTTMHDHRRAQCRSPPKSAKTMKSSRGRV